MHTAGLSAPSFLRRVADLESFGRANTTRCIETL